MGLFGGGNSSTLQTSNTTNSDQRQAVQGGQANNAGGGAVATDGGIAVTTNGNVKLIETPGAAFDLAQQSLTTLAQALNTTQANSAAVLAQTQTAAQGATSSLSTKLIQFGIPAVVLIYWLKGSK
ncbi:MAG: hypothetical protein GC186_16505 [Rhodobacteraceae bacterium]|nr:hypothetical protein [Paracoccaceae bacterium]